jgi:hypothetical protein
VRFRSRLHAVALAVPVLVTGAALAQEDGLGGKSPQPNKGEPRRVLETLVTILESTHKNDPKPALAGLRDAHWAVRQFAAIRLGALGLEGDVLRKLIDASHCGSATPGKEDANVAAAEKWAAAWKPEKAGDETPVASPADEAMRIVGSLVRNELSVRSAQPAQLVKLVLELPAFAEAARDARAASFAAREIASIVDTDSLLVDLGAESVNEAVEGNGKHVFEWLRQNGRFLYFHPGDRGLRLDAAARSANQSSEDFRKQTPWAKGEGPEAPANPKKKDIK